MTFFVMLEEILLKNKSQRIALFAVLSAISVVLDSIITPGFSAGVWFGWIFIMSPVNGILLGPVYGFITTLLSVMVGHTLVFRESIYEYIFTLGAPVASLITGLIYKRRKTIVTLYFIVLLGAYFLTPVSWTLPIWGMWDVYLTLLILLIWSLPGLGSKFINNPRVILGLSTLIGLEADILFRIFILIPLKGYSIFYGLTPEVLAVIWAVPAPLITPFKVIISTFFTVILVPKLLKQIKSKELTWGVRTKSCARARKTIWRWILCARI
jgi:hypothetical protein